MPIGQLSRPLGALVNKDNRDHDTFKRAFDALTADLNQWAPSVYNVFGVGAKGNGLTDDGPAWNAARAAAVAGGGGTVYVPAGAYNLATAFTFAGASNVTLWLEPGVVLSGSALPTPTGTQSIVDWRSGVLVLSGAFTVSGLLTASAGIAVSGGGTVNIGHTTPDAWAGLNVTVSLVSAIGGAEFGILCTPNFGSAATSSVSVFSGRIELIAGAYTVPTGYGLRVTDASLGAGAALTTQYGIKVESQTMGATNYALVTGTGLVVLGDATTISGLLTASAGVTAGAPVTLKGYTVATLPAGVVGMTAYVTNALAPAYGAAVAGGGAATIPVFYNGAAWIVA